MKNYITHINHKKTFYILASMAMMFVAGYGYFLMQTVWNVVERQDMTRAISRMSSEVAELEATYMNTTSDLTLEYAHTLGFSEVKTANKVYVERTVTTVAVR